MLLEAQVRVAGEAIGIRAERTQEVLHFAADFGFAGAAIFHARRLMFSSFHFLHPRKIQSSVKTNARHDTFVEAPLLVGRSFLEQGEKKG